MSDAPAVNGRADTYTGTRQERLRDGAACLQAALDYLAHGWPALAVCPPDHASMGKTHAKDCTSPGKAPWGPWKEFQERLPTEAELRKKWRDNPTLNVGVALGRLLRIDVDGPGGEARLRGLSGGDLPPTLEFTSGRPNGGRGLLYLAPEGVELRTTPGAAGNKQELRLQAKGAQTVLPPSRHPTGTLYAWKPGHGPAEVEPAQAPSWLVEQLRAGQAGGRHRGKAGSTAAGERIGETARNDTLTSLAGAMRRKSCGEQAILAALLVVNREQCDPPLEEVEVAKVARSVARYPPAVSGYDLILAHFGTLYEPVFRRGTSIYSARLGREVRSAESCFGAGKNLIDKLATAADAPRNSGGVLHNALPAFFQTWAKSAWADLLCELPEEEEAAEVSDAAVQDFAGLVSAALHTIISLGHVHPETGETQVEQRSLIDWCSRFAKVGAWDRVRSFQIWSCAVQDEHGQRVRIALRAELFAQLRRGDLPKLTQNKLSRLCTLYGIGAPVRLNDRQRAVELEPLFLGRVVGRRRTGRTLCRTIRVARVRAHARGKKCQSVRKRDKSMNGNTLDHVNLPDTFLSIRRSVMRRAPSRDDTFQNCQGSVIAHAGGWVCTHPQRYTPLLRKEGWRGSEAKQRAGRKLKGVARPESAKGVGCCTRPSRTQGVPHGLPHLSLLAGH